MIESEWQMLGGYRQWLLVVCFPCSFHILDGVSEHVCLAVRQLIVSNFVHFCGVLENSLIISPKAKPKRYPGCQKSPLALLKTGVCVNQITLQCTHVHMIVHCITKEQSSVTFWSRLQPRPRMWRESKRLICYPGYKK